MKLYDAAAVAALGYHCVTVLRRVIPPVGGKWIPYTAAQVAARRAAQMVVCVVCTAIPPTAAEAPPMPPPAITGPPLVLVPGTTPGTVPGYVATPEPGSAGLFLVAVWFLRRQIATRGVAYGYGPQRPSHPHPPG